MTTEGLLLDIDGVLTQGAPDALRTLAARVLFRVVTNSSQRSCATLTGNLTALGFDVGPEAIFTPARAAARHLKDRSATAYLATREDARTQFLELGVVIYDGQPDFVVPGDLGEDLGYGELNHVLRFLLCGAGLIALGRTRISRPPDCPVLDVGPFAVLFEEATGVKAQVFGKPDRDVFKDGARALGIEPGRVAMVGDDAEVDVTAASRAGLGAGILIRTGKYRTGDESRHTPAPDAVYTSFPALAEAFLTGEVIVG